MGIVENILGGLFAVVIGPLCLVIGRSILSDAVNILRAPSATAGNSSSELVTVTGTVTQGETTLTGPLSGEGCVVYALGEDKRGWVRDPFRVYGWKAVGGTAVMIPFTLETPDGQVSIDPRRPSDDESPASWDYAPTRTWNSRFNLPVTATEQCAAEDSPSETLVSAIESHPRLHEPGDTKKRYREWTLRPGDTVSIFGTVDTTTAAPVSIMNDGTFVISTGSLRRAAFHRFVTGGLVVGFGTALLGWLAYSLGVVAFVFG